ncbi:hypothetical protein TNCV_1034491 [Trichonephila clavipes]|nr:hypothetical protein TNCV_1034491 [Trichonephila clavipes]
MKLNSSKTAGPILMKVFVCSSGLEKGYNSEYTSTGLAWQLTRPDQSMAMPECMATICSNALDSMNTWLTTSSIGIGKVSVKWSSSQARALDK